MRERTKGRMGWWVNSSGQNKNELSLLFLVGFVVNVVPHSVPYMTATTNVELPVVSPRDIQGTAENGDGTMIGSTEIDFTPVRSNLCEKLFGCFGNGDGRWMKKEMERNRAMTDRAVEKAQEDVKVSVLKDTNEVREDVKAALQALKEEMQEMKEDVKAEVEKDTGKVGEDVRAEVKALKEEMREMKKLLLGIREVLALPKVEIEEGRGTTGGTSMGGGAKIEVEEEEVGGGGGGGGGKRNEGGDDGKAGFGGKKTCPWSQMLGGL